MNKFLLSTAVILSIGGAALAQTDTPAADTADQATADAPAVDAVAKHAGDMMKTGLVRASAFHDVDLYTVDVTGGIAWDDTTIYSDVNADWDKIGEIKDLVVDFNQNVVGAIADVGGFLGIGEKSVFLLPEESAFIVTPDRVAVVSALSKDQLEQREEVANDMYHGK